MRRPFIAANWKMNKTVPEALDFVQSFLSSVKDINDTEIVIAPPFTALHAMSDKIKGSNVMLSAQNAYFEEKGAFTGEVSPCMLKDTGCEYVIIGHSERRQYFHESDEIVNKKIKTAQKNGLKVIFCIGETLDQREAGRTFDVLNSQIENGLKDIDASGIVAAYEPVWAIGTGKTATPDQAQEAHLHIRNRLRELVGEAANTIRILYGGSVTPENVDILMACPDVDGALVGGASLKPDSFERIVRFKRGIK
jgi:triosephosphate isomerase